MKYSSVTEPLYQRYGREVCRSRPGSASICYLLSYVTNVVCVVCGLDCETAWDVSVFSLEVMYLLRAV